MGAPAKTEPSYEVRASRTLAQRLLWALAERGGLSEQQVTQLTFPSDESLDAAEAAMRRDV